MLRSGRTAARILAANLGKQQSTFSLEGSTAVSVASRNNVTSVPGTKKDFPKNEYGPQPNAERLARLEEFARYVNKTFPKFIEGAQFAAGDELEFLIHPSGVKPVIHFLKAHHACQYDCLTCITGIDVPSRENRFEVIYQLLSIRFNERVRVKTYCDELTPIDTVTGIFLGAGWFEREVHDMYGVFFKGHPDLRRILTDYGFDGYPFRKDFPIQGYSEVRYDDELKRVVHEPVEMAQEFRRFDLESPWEQFPKFREASKSALVKTIDLNK